MGALVCICALMLSSLEDAKVIEVLFERDADPALLERYDISCDLVEVKESVPREELLAEVKAAKPSPIVVRIDLCSLDGRRFRRCAWLGSDRILAAEQQRLTQIATERFSSGLENKQVFERFTYVGGRHGNFSDGPLVFDVPPEVMHFEEIYRGPGGEHVQVEVFDGNDRPVTVHQFLRVLIPEECRLMRGRPGVMVRSVWREPGMSRGDIIHRVSWLTEDGKAFYITGIGVDPEPLSGLWKEKCPSALPRNLRIDKRAWGRDEFEYWLGRMKKAAEAPPGIEYWIGRSRHFPERVSYFDGEVRAISRYVHSAQQTVVFPHIEGIASQDVSSDKLREQYRVLAEWWPTVRERTYWDKKWQMLMAPGWTPEEIAARAEAKEKARVDAILDAPITEERKAEILAGASVALETFVRDRYKSCKEAGDSAAALDTSDNYIWRLVRTIPGKTPELFEEVYSNQEIREQTDRRYPFSVAYDQRIRIMTGPNQTPGSTSHMVLLYDKLEGKWVER